MLEDAGDATWTQLVSSNSLPNHKPLHRQVLGVFPSNEVSLFLLLVTSN